MLVKDPEKLTKTLTYVRILGITLRGELFVILKSLSEYDVKWCYKIRGSNYSKKRSLYLANRGVKFIKGDCSALVGCK